MIPISPIHDGNWRDFAAPIYPDQWSVIIPAAGRGSRLGFDKPKILYPIAGRPIFEWLCEQFKPWTRHIVLVLSPDGAPVVEPIARRALGDRLKIAIQHTPEGMGDAVEIGLASVTTPFVAIVWGDQAAIRPSTIEATLALQTGPYAPAMTAPTLWRDNPYIHFQRDPDGALSRILQAREGDVMPQRGESDAGFFAFSTPVLRSLLSQLRSDTASHGAVTGEFNLLPAFALAARQNLRVLTPQYIRMEETIGINSPADAALLESMLNR